MDGWKTLHQVSALHFVLFYFLEFTLKKSHDRWFQNFAKSTSLYKSRASKKYVVLSRAELKKMRKFYDVTIKMKVTGWSFFVVLFLETRKVVWALNSVDEILQCFHCRMKAMNEAVLSSGRFDDFGISLL